MKELEEKFVTGDNKKKPKAKNEKKQPYNWLTIDFDGLRGANPDIVAWIDIPGTPISYPVAQTVDDDYYLHHTIDGVYSAYGAIFLSSLNEQDFSDSHSVIYGHNMNDGSMFAFLNQYAGVSVFTQSPVVHIYRPGYVGVYKIFSYYQASVGGDSFDLSNRLGSKAYRTQLENAKVNSEYDTGVEINANKPYVSLLTCNPWHNYGSRTAIHAILDEEYELAQQ